MFTTRSFVVCKYFSHIIFRAIKFWRVRWVGHVTRMREMINAYERLVVKPEDLGISGGGIVLKWDIEEM